MASSLDTNANAVKSLLHRARAALATARDRSDVDIPVDADAIQAGSIERITSLLAEDVWSMVDGAGGPDGSQADVRSRPTPSDESMPS